MGSYALCTSFLLAACAGEPPLPRAVRAGAGPLPPTAASYETGWARLSELGASLARNAPRGDAACVSHVGCTVKAKGIPACTPPGNLEPGYSLFTGILERDDALLFTLGRDRVLRCNNSYSAMMRVRTASGDFPLWDGLSCRGDRSGLCCTVPEGTPVQVVARAETVGERVLLKDSYVCSTGAAPPEPASHAPGVPIAIDTGARPMHLGLREPGEEAEPLAFWFGERLALWDVASDRLRVVGDARGPALACATTSPNGEHVFTLDVTGAAAVWDPAGNRTASVASIAPAHHRGRVEPDLSCGLALTRHAAWSGAGNALLVVSNDGRAAAWVSGAAGFRTLKAAHATGDASLDRSGTVALLGDDEGFVELWSLATGERIARTPGTRGRLAADGSVAAVTRSDGGAADIWAPWNPSEPSPSAPLGCNPVFAPSGHAVAFGDHCVTSRLGVVVLPGAGAEPVRFESLPTWAWFPDSERLLVPTAEGLAVWSRDGKRGLRVPAIARPPGAVAVPWVVSPDGLRAASRSTVVDLKSGRATPIATEPTAEWSAFSPDGTLLAAWSLRVVDPAMARRGAARVQVFDAKTGRELADVDDGEPTLSARQAILGPASPRWLPGTDLLELAVLGGESFVRLLRPRTGQIWFATASERGGAITPFVIAADGRYTGDADAVSSVLARPGAPRVTGTPTRVGDSPRVTPAPSSATGTSTAGAPVSAASSATAVSSIAGRRPR